MSSLDNLRKLIESHKRRLQRLKEQQALFGLHTPPHILIEIEDIEIELEKLQAELVTLKNSGLDEQIYQSPISNHINLETKSASCIRLRQAPSKDKTLLFESYQRFISIGRSSKNTMQVLDQEVSWEHGQIVLMQGTYHYRHLSKNNPSILDRRGEKHLLRLGQQEEISLRNQDRLTVGKTTFIIEFDLIGEDTDYVPTDKQEDM